MYFKELIILHRVIFSLFSLQIELFLFGNVYMHLYFEEYEIPMNFINFLLNKNNTFPYIVDHKNSSFRYNFGNINFPYVEIQCELCRQRYHL